MKHKTIIIGENHESPSARIFALNCFRNQKENEFSFFGFEHGENTSIKEEIEWLQEDLDVANNCCIQLLVWGLFNHEYKRMLSNRQLLNLFKYIDNNNIPYQGIDVDIGNRWAPDVTIIRNQQKIADAANSSNINEVYLFRERKMVSNILKHCKLPGIVIVGLLHLKSIQELLIEEKGEEFVRDNYEFKVIRGMPLANETIREYTDDAVIPIDILDSYSDYLNNSSPIDRETNYLKMD